MDSGTTTTSPVAAVQDESTRPRLLIIDDEPAVARLVERVARELGFRVCVTGTAEAFIGALQTEMPDAIVLDLSLPDTDGIELLRALGQLDCGAKILIISGFDPRVLETSARLGSALDLDIVGTLSKPMRLADLRRTIAKLNRKAE